MNSWIQSCFYTTTDDAGYKSDQHVNIRCLWNLKYRQRRFTWRYRKLMKLKGTHFSTVWQWERCNSCAAFWRPSSKVPIYSHRSYFLNIKMLKRATGPTPTTTTTTMIIINNKYKTLCFCFKKNSSQHLLCRNHRFKYPKSQYLSLTFIKNNSVTKEFSVYE